MGLRAMKLDKDDLGRLLLRVTVAGLMLFHGVHKLRHGIDGIHGMVQRHGLPGFVAYGVYLGEFLAPLLVLVGLFTRPAALVLAGTMPFAVWLVHTSDLFALNARSGAYALELQALYFLGAVCVALLGGGRYSLRRTRWE